MYIHNGQPFNVWIWQVMEDGVQAAPGFFLDEYWAGVYHIYQVPDPVPPTITDLQVVELVEFQLIGGVWTPIWNIRDKTPDELAYEAWQLSVAKDAKNKQINKWREEANLTSFPFAGKQIACDSLSYRDIMSIAVYVLMFGDFEPGFPGVWKAMDNTYVPLATTNDFKAMYDAMVAQGTANFNHSQELKAQVAAATKTNQLDSIVW